MKMYSWPNFASLVAMDAKLHFANGTQFIILYMTELKSRNYFLWNMLNSSNFLYFSSVVKNEQRLLKDYTYIILDKE